MRELLGDAVFLRDVPATGGLDDRLTRGRVLQSAQELMADAVHAEHTFFSTCGSSLSVKAAMLSVAGPHEKLLIGRDAMRTGLEAGMYLPDPSDPGLETVRVVGQDGRSLPATGRTAPRLREPLGNDLSFTHTW